MESSNILNHVMNYSLDMICTIDAAGRFIQVSASCRQVLGYNPEELKGCFTKDFIHPKDRSKTVEFFKYVSTGNTNTSFENCCIKKSKEEVSLSWSAVWSAEDKSFFCIVRDATAQNAAAKEIHHRKELQQLLLAHGSDMMALLDENGNYLYVAGTSVKTLGYEPDQLIGVNALHLIHSEDVAQAQQALILIQQTREPVKLSDIRIKTVDGQWRWVEITVSNQLENPAIKAIFVSSQDITQRKRAQLQVTQSEQRFRSLFQNNPDLMLYQDEAGVILDANPAFLSFIKKPKEEVLNRPLYDFLPQEVVPIFKKKLEEAFAGSEVKFKADVNLKELGQKILSVVKVPLRIGHKVVGVHAVIKDITKIIQAQRTIEKQAQKLNAILESITDAFYTLDKNWNFTFINGECERVLQVNRQALLGKNLWSSFPPDITQQLYKPYQQAIETGETIHFEAYLNTYKSWFDIKVYPSEEGLSVYFQDVTQQVNSKEELEKLSLVARKITNGVVITDAQGLTEWVNEGFTHITGYTLSDIIGKKPGTILQGPETDPATIKRISNKIKTGKPFTDEILNYKKTGQQFWIHKEVTPILNERGEVIKFIAIQNDITERKKVAAELEKLSLVASKTINGVIITDAAGRVEWINKGFTRNTGYTLTDIIGKKPGDLLQGPDTDMQEVQRVREKLKEAVPFNSMLINYKKSGEALWISMDISPVFDQAGNLTQYIALQKDISFRKEAEANLLKMSKDLFEQNRDMQQFTYIISHNLRSPVANAVGLSRMLLQLDKQSKEFNVSLTYLNESVLRLDEVLKDINLILSIRDRKNVLEKISIPVYEVCQQVLVDLAEPLLQSNGQVNVDIEKELTIQANRAYLYSIFYNLLSNAIKYRSEKMALQINIKAAKIPDGGISITFSDNGSGFDMKKAGDNVFKLYKRFHPNKEGKGIGLFLVKTHVEAMNGRIEAKSQVDIGTSFTIYLN